MKTTCLLMVLLAVPAFADDEKDCMNEFRITHKQYQKYDYNKL